MLLAANVRMTSVWDDAIAKNPVVGQHSEQGRSLIIGYLMPKFWELSSLNLGFHKIQQDGSMGPTKLVNDSFSRLDTMDHVPCAIEEVFLSPQTSQELDNVKPLYIRM